MAGERMAGDRSITRRSFLGAVAGASLALGGCARSPTAAAPFRLRYALASALYGDLPLASILPEVAATGCAGLDLWGRVHGTQREEAAAMGDQSFQALLGAHQVPLLVSTRYPLGPFKLGEELAWMSRLGKGGTIVTGTPGPGEPTGGEARTAMADFLERMKPHVARAEELGITIALENHERQLLCHPDALRSFADLNRSPRLGVAFAPHQLHRWTAEIPALIRRLGASNLPFVYLQEHGEGSVRQVDKAIELRQLPGFGGTLDYRPMLGALREVGFSGLAEIFMHPTPRGVPILPTVAGISAAVRRSRAHIDACVADLPG